MIYIYALIDPFTKEIRYIGKSIRPKQRLNNHCNEKSKTWRTNWIQSVLKKGKRPELLILETLNDNEDWQKSEIEWIKKGREKGWNITNCTDGGDGLCNPPEEVRQKMLKTWTGRKHTEKSKEKNRQSQLGKKHTEETKLKMSKAHKGRKITWADKVSKGTSKLDDSQIKEVYKLLSEKVSQYVIADIFGVHQTTISNIKRGLIKNYNKILEKENT